MTEPIDTANSILLVVTAIATFAAAPGSSGVVGAAFFLAAFIAYELLQARHEYREQQTDTSTQAKTVEVEKEVVPYQSWPDTCYACNKEITESMEKRSQFAVHKGESLDEVKSVPLCDECTWTYSTMIDSHGKLTQIWEESPAESFI